MNNASWAHIIDKLVATAPEPTDEQINAATTIYTEHTQRGAA